MKTLIAALLLSMSSVTLADAYYSNDASAYPIVNPIYYSPMARNLSYAERQQLNDQWGVDVARYRQFQREQWEANYNAMRQGQLDRRDSERFISNYREPSSMIPTCVYKAAMSDEEIRNCNR